jgi:exopolysaccharide biosynthesis polyprenyl glycosylphosphotransferase
LPIKLLEDEWFLICPGFEKVGDGFYSKVKRIVDVAISTILLIITSPLFLIIPIIIKISSRGPIFYVQERSGLDEKRFKLIKFRTMVNNAEENGPQWASENDPRVTRVGKILRKLRLDELPQLINVLKGDMSLIGPRPERDNFIRELKTKIRYYSLRFYVKPGITGWAQINYRYGASLEDAIEKLAYDLYYIKNMSLLLDISIILKTIRVVLLGHGAR